MSVKVRCYVIRGLRSDNMLILFSSDADDNLTTVTRLLQSERI